LVKAADFDSAMRRFESYHSRQNKRNMMKLFRFFNANEGTEVPRDAVITVGRKIENGKPNGFYIILRSLFITKGVSQMCPHEFVMKTQNCRKTWRFMARRFCGNGEWIKGSMSMLVPVE
jgi:hypothetical protein